MTGATSKCICGIQPPEKWLTQNLCATFYSFNTFRSGVPADENGRAASWYYYPNDDDEQHSSFTLRARCGRWVVLFLHQVRGLLFAAGEIFYNCGRWDCWRSASSWSRKTTVRRRWLSRWSFEEVGGKYLSDFDKHLDKAYVKVAEDS